MTRRVTAGATDLALLSDCRTATLVTRDGSIDWWPGSRFDGPSVFSRVLDPDAGLLAEMADPATGEPRRNLPQALSHVGRIYAARELERALEAVPS
jgi:GH15 family glucan-1,4-alpha-glucosidase